VSEDKPLLFRWWFWVLMIVVNTAFLWLVLFVALPALIRVCKAAWNNP